MLRFAPSPVQAMSESPSPFRSKSADDKSARKQRATAARAHASAVKAWTVHVTAAASGTKWRMTSAWIEQACGTRCADFTHVSTGKVRTLRFETGDSVETCRARIAVD
jgi:hypothetical protein